MDSAPNTDCVPPMERFVEAVSGAPESIVWVDANGYLSFANRRAMQDFDLSGKDLHLVHISKLIPELDDTRLQKLHTRIKLEGSVTLECRCRGHDLHLNPTETRLSLLQNGRNGKDFLLSLFIRDIVARNEAERLLQLVARTISGTIGQDFFRTLARSLADALNIRMAFVTECLDHPTTRVQTLAFWADNAPTDRLEYDLAGTPCDIVINGGKICYYPGHLEEIFPKEKGLGVESYLGVPIFNAAETRVIGHIALLDVREIPENFYLKTVFDIFCSRAGAEMERMQTEKKAHQTLLELAHLSRLNSMEEMASAFAHEVNQPLCAILSYSQACQRMIKSGQIDFADLGQAIDRMAVNAELAGNIIKQMRGYVKKGDVEFEPVDLVQLIQDTLILAQVEVKDTRTTIEFESEKSLPTVNVNATQIQQVILNLLRNATEAIGPSDSSGNIGIEVRHLTPNKLQVSICDTGPGIQKELLGRLFEPFVFNKPDGIGIGLSICKSIIESHGGSINAINQPSGGACFRFILPLTAKTD